MWPLRVLVLFGLLGATVHCLDSGSFLFNFAPRSDEESGGGASDDGHQQQSTSARPSTKQADETKYQALELIHKSIGGILETRGFKSQVHYAVTRDGYYIHLVRLINPLLRGRAPPKRPVVFNHGLIEDGAIWVLSSRDVKPEDRTHDCETTPLDVDHVKNSTEFLNGPMLLANHGYDVWLMSMRGTDYSTYHETLDSSAPAFWDYSLDQFALEDVPGVIRYVSKHTGHPKVAYVGHSQATFSVFGLLASKPHYANRIEPVFAVAPVAYMHHLTSLAKALFLEELKNGALHGPVPEDSRAIREKLWKVCGPDNPILLPFKLICGLVDTLIGGPGKASLTGYLSFFPHRTSHKVLRHFAQIITKEKFTMYDHGPEENMKRYGRLEAPTYKVGNIKSRSITLIWSRTDSLSDPRDVERFKSELRVPLYRDIYIDRVFNHFDLITHEDARYLVFGPILEVLEEFEQRHGFCTDSNRPLDSMSGDEFTGHQKSREVVSNELADVREQSSDAHQAGEQ